MDARRSGRPRAQAVAVVALACTACAGITEPRAGLMTATAELRDARGAMVGTARLTEVKDGVRVLMEVRNLAQGPKAVHVHAVGRCDPPDFATAGSHFNPDGKAHGFDSPAGPHAGDLPNVTVGADGTGRLESMNERIRLAAGPASLFDADGSAIVIHADPDDFRTDPAGNSGARIACGVITRGR